MKKHFETLEPIEREWGARLCSFGGSSPFGGGGLNLNTIGGGYSPFGFQRASGQPMGLGQVQTTPSSYQNPFGQGTAPTVTPPNLQGAANGVQLARNQMTPGFGWSPGGAVSAGNNGQGTGSNAAPGTIGGMFGGLGQVFGMVPSLSNIIGNIFGINPNQTSIIGSINGGLPGGMTASEANNAIANNTFGGGGTSAVGITGAPTSPGVAPDGTTGTASGPPGGPGSGPGPGGGGGGPCFLTTAVTRHESKPDDCVELATLRKFRDEHMLKSAAGRSLVETYYRIAPPIVEKIDRLADRDLIYAKMRIYIGRAIDAINRGQNEEATQIYTALIGYAQSV